MANQSNREIRKMLLEEREAKSKILEQGLHFKSQLGITSKQMEYHREALKKYKATRWYRFGKYFKLI